MNLSVSREQKLCGTCLIHESQSEDETCIGVGGGVKIESSREVAAQASSLNIEPIRSAWLY